MQGNQHLAYVSSVGGMDKITIRCNNSRPKATRDADPVDPNKGQPFTQATDCTFQIRAIVPKKGNKKRMWWVAAPQSSTKLHWLNFAVSLLLACRKVEYINPAGHCGACLVYDQRFLTTEVRLLCIAPKSGTVTEPDLPTQHQDDEDYYLEQWKIGFEVGDAAAFLVHPSLQQGI